MAKLTDVLEGLKILDKYGPGEVSPGHDQLWAGPENNPELSDEDKKKMEKHTWFIDEECDCWSLFT